MVCVLVCSIMWPAYKSNGKNDAQNFSTYIRRYFFDQVFFPNDFGTKSQAFSLILHNVVTLKVIFYGVK